LGALLLALLIAGPIPTIAGAEVNVSISLPPPIVFAAPPEMIVLPETYVYVVPDVEADIFFYNGWWWRPWEGRWYRSRNYNSGWGYYRHVPSFYRGIPSNWRNDYRERRWRGHQWDYQRIPHQQVQKNWRGWEKNRHWEKQKSWGVQGLKPKPQVRTREAAKQKTREVNRAKSRESVKQQTRKVDKAKTREAAKQKTREVNKTKSRESVKQQTRKVDRTKTREAKPQSREMSKPKNREAKPQSREMSKPKTREAKPQSHEAAKPKSGGDKAQHKQQQQGHDKGK
jgi:hypothetical protein